MPRTGQTDARRDERARADVDGGCVEHDAVVVYDRQPVRVDVEAVVAAEVRLDERQRVAGAEQLAQNFTTALRFVRRGAVILPAKPLGAQLRRGGGVLVPAGIGCWPLHNLNGIHKIAPLVRLGFDPVAVERLPAEADDGDDDRDERDGLVQRAAPRLHEHVVEQHTRRVHGEVSDADIAGVVRPVADRPGDRRGDGQQTDRAAPCEQRGSERQRRKDGDPALPAHECALVVLREHGVARDVHEQTQRTAERAEQRELQTERQAAERLHDEKTLVRLDLKRDEKEQQTQKPDGLHQNVVKAVHDNRSPCDEFRRRVYQKMPAFAMDTTD